MRKQDRILLLVLAMVLLSCSSWVFFATTPLGGSLSGLTHEFLASFLDVLQTEGKSASDISKTAPASQSIHEVAQDPLVFSAVYVVSLPHRVDRRIGMDRLAQAIGMNWTYFNAVSSTSSVVRAIVEKAVISRVERSTNPWYPAEFSWPDSLGDTERNETLAWLGSRHFSAAALSSSSAVSREVWRNSVAQPEEPSVPLTCATGNKTSGPPYDQTLPPYMILSPSKIACWYSHAQVLQQILSGYKDDAWNAKDAFLILEDDVDVERDLYHRLQGVWGVLPVDWDMVFLGHCWSNESYWPALYSSTTSRTTLHPSRAPKCTHAYAISPRGAAKLLAHLYYPPFAYSRALDQAYSWLIQTGRLNSYSIVPSIVVQRKLLSSDVDPGESGVGSMWREQLVNGVF